MAGSGSDGREVEAHEGVWLGGNGDEQDIGLRGRSLDELYSSNLEADAVDGRRAPVGFDAW